MTGIHIQLRIETPACESTSCSPQKRGRSVSAKIEGARSGCRGPDVDRLLLPAGSYTPTIQISASPGPDSGSPKRVKTEFHQHHHHHHHHCALEEARQFGMSHLVSPIFEFEDAADAHAYSRRVAKQIDIMTDGLERKEKLSSKNKAEKYGYKVGRGDWEDWHEHEGVDWDFESLKKIVKKKKGKKAAEETGAQVKENPPQQSKKKTEPIVIVEGKKPEAKRIAGTVESPQWGMMARDEEAERLSKEKEEEAKRELREKNLEEFRAEREREREERRAEKQQRKLAKKEEREKAKAEKKKAATEQLNEEEEPSSDEEKLLYKFPSRGKAPWSKLTTMQRIEKIDTDPLDKFLFFLGDIKESPVYCSIMDLTSSSEMLAILVHWLHSDFASRIPYTEFGNTVTKHAWELIEFILRNDGEKLEEVKEENDYEEKLVPRLQLWQDLQILKENAYTDIEKLWDAGWKERCIKAAGRRINWTNGVVMTVRRLAAVAIQRDIKQENAWELVIEKVQLRNSSGTVTAHDIQQAIDELSKKPAITVNCGCPVALREILPNLPMPRNGATIMPPAEALELLKSVRARLPPPEHDFAALCHSHLRRLASGTCGLLNNPTSHVVLVERLSSVYQNLIRDGENPHIVQNPEWFRKPFRPKPVAGDASTQDLGMYKYPVQNPKSITHSFSSKPTTTGLSTFKVDREEVFTRFSSLEKYQEFLKHGTVRIPGLFAHLDPAIIDQDFDMYEHHFQPPPGTKPMGWLRIMYHSITQQAIRQDPVLYALHAAAREDGCWRFISYPYYTKSTSPEGEKTGFFHFDLNVNEYLANGKSQHVVQSAVTLVRDETPKGCTMLVPGFHKHIREWWARHPDGRKGGETTNIIPGKTYTKEDEWDFGPFVPYPCKAGDLRLTRPDIPHGSTPTSTARRRVVFPWLIGIRDDHETLDVDTTETWSELAACHRDMLACKKSTSGRSASAYGRPDGRWAGGMVKLGSTSCIGDALIGRRRWDDPDVVAERDLLLGEGRDEEARVWVAQVRERIKREFEWCCTVVKRVEREEFGENAFFRNEA